MPEKFPYPEEAWSKGRMRKAGEVKEARIPITNRSGVSGAEVRELEGVRKQKTQQLSQNEPQQMQQMSKEDFDNYWKGNWSVTGKIHKIDPNQVDPTGTIVEHGHPQIQELQKNGWESFSLPDEGWSKGHMLMRPPQDSPTPVGQGSTVMGVG